MTENQLRALYMDFQQEWFEIHSEDFISDEEREKILLEGVDADQLLTTI